MKWIVMKEFSFDSAHRLINQYQGKCKHIHGHTWRVRIFAEARKLDQFGFVKDYSDFKVLKNWVDKHLDHASIISKDDIEWKNWLLKSEQRVFIMDENPTSENIAKLLFNVSTDLGLSPVAIEIDETCTSRCRYENT